MIVADGLVQSFKCKGTVNETVKVLVDNTCVGEVFGVDPDIHLEDITSNISSSVGIISCTRRGNTLRVTFEGTTAPEELLLFKQRRAVRACLSRPLQCTRCGVYGHAAATCSRDRHCLRCGRGHTEGPCTAENPRCLNCKGRHPANEPRCSSWQLQRQTAFILATSGGKLTRRQALEKAQVAAQAKRNGAPAASTTRPGHSFRDALRDSGTPASNTTPPAKGSTSAAPTGDTKDSVMTALAAALRALLDSVVCDSPAREMCAAALAAHQAIAHHG
ncbi:hypothetical protein HPB52_016733 [Rhipicephalus sanguineus]|uniref:CCHC-type domain-containing protein n=1 Tax=Rhipicephalus sanguineus TaxID=34632 RepID=A0A9D4SXM3_RHISA|nr:hypothetical protein HPB52_016733 [Rhipicephalus sanguineus]